MASKSRRAALLIEVDVKENTDTRNGELSVVCLVKIALVGVTVGYDKRVTRALDSEAQKTKKAGDAKLIQKTHEGVQLALSSFLHHYRGS